MRIPPRLVPLIDDGIIDRIVRPLMSGKEAQVYLVEVGGTLKAAKVYKASNDRTFRNRSSYTEGRKVRNSRDQRAMAKRSRHGRERDEQTWKSAESDTLYKLHAAGVRVPVPYAFIEGVLVMECVVGPDGGPAPRLAECTLEPELARSVFEQLIGEVIKMLCADVVHGDLSPFNILIEDAGPVIIDFPQAIDAATNRNARTILMRDVANLTSHFMRDRPEEEKRFAHEMWSLYESGDLRPDTRLSGSFELSQHIVDADELLLQMLEVEEDEAIGAEGNDPSDERPAPRSRGRSSGGGGSGKGRRAKERAGPQVFVKGQAPPRPAEPSVTDAPPRKRRRRRRSRGGGAGGDGRGGTGGGGGPNGGGRSS